MKKFSVIVPFAGAVSVYVEAENEDAAKEAAWGKLDCTITPDHPDEVDVLGWEFLDYIVRGNVCIAPYREISVEEEQ